MKNLILIYFMLIQVTIANAQWYQVNSNTTERLKDIIMVDENIGYSTGGGDIYNYPEGNGVILKTIDGGENWSTIFSQDSLAIYAIGIIDNNLYGFAMLNGADKLVFSDNDGTTWSVSDFNYKPWNVRNINNSIYFQDGNDNFNLKQLSSSGVVDLAQNVSLFGVNENEIVYINNQYDIIFKSNDNGATFQALASYPTEFGQNQSTDATIKSFGDTIIVHYTYPNATQYSTDIGATWVHTGYDGSNGSAGANYCEIISSSLLMGSFNNSLNSQISFQPWEEEETLSDNIRKIYIYSENLGFVVGDNGMIYKTTNVEGLSTNDVNIEKKKIKIIPNPATDVILIENTGNINIKSLELFDLSGKKIKDFPINTNQLDISSLSNGNYLLRIATPKTTFSEKIIKK